MLSPGRAGPTRHVHGDAPNRPVMAVRFPVDAQRTQPDLGQLASTNRDSLWMPWPLQRAAGKHQYIDTRLLEGRRAEPEPAGRSARSAGMPSTATSTTSAGGGA